MSVWKKIIMALVIAGSIGAFTAYSTVAVAAEDRAGSQQATADTIKTIEKGIAETKNGSTAQEIKVYYFEARQFSKDINGETIARDLQDGADSLFAVSRALKPDHLGNVDMDKVLAAWEEALTVFKYIQKKQL